MQTSLPNSCCNCSLFYELRNCQRQLSVIRNVEDENNGFDTPVLWVGFYIAAASLVCSVAMATDVVQNFRYRRFWFPCYYFGLNAASLTLLAVVTKLPVEISNPMPGRTDKLAKLSSMVYFCTAIGNVMPSLGNMNNNDIFTNIIALAILVITVIVNICVEIGTGLISYLTIEYCVVMVFTIFLLVILSLTAITVSTTKRHIEMKYVERHTIAANENVMEAGKFMVEKLKNEVRKFWVMAETGGPQFVMARSATSSASGAICFLVALTLLEAEFRMYWSSIALQDTRSDYKWSTSIILIIQSVGVVVGTIAPAFRWFTVVTFECLRKDSTNYQNEFKIEHYWIERLVEWKQSPLALEFRGRKVRRLFHDIKVLIIRMCIGLQIVNVVVSKFIRLVSIFLMNPFVVCWHYYKRLKKKFMPMSSTSSSHIDRSKSGADINLDDLGCYALILEGEEQLPKRVLRNICDAANEMIEKGKKQQPRHLMKLLEISNGFKGVAEFDSNKVPCLTSIEPPNCWTLPVVTLTSIAIALPKINDRIADIFIRSVSKGLFYVSLIEKSLDAQGDLLHIRNAANVVWLGVELYRKWLDEDLQKMPIESKTSKESLQKLASAAKKSIMEFKNNMNQIIAENAVNWPVQVIAANSMYRISETILLDYTKGSENKAEDGLFEKLSVKIANILAACLTNLPHVITKKCYCSAIEEREESVCQAASLLGETENILKILQEFKLSLSPDQAAHISEWCASTDETKSPAALSPFNNEVTSSECGELGIAIE